MAYVEISASSRRQLRPVFGVSGQKGDQGAYASVGKLTGAEAGADTLW
jgi:hypothetical protein